MKDTISIQDFNNLLKTSNIYPIINNWNHFSIEHFNTSPDEISRKDTLEMIKNNVGKKSGLYAYFNSQNICIYIGKGKPLFNRIKSHYQESYTPPGSKGGKWNEFFHNHIGELKVYWIELVDEEVRALCERLIAKLENPLFETLHPRIK